MEKVRKEGTGESREGRKKEHRYTFHLSRPEITKGPQSSRSTGVDLDTETELRIGWGPLLFTG